MGFLDIFRIGKREREILNKIIIYIDLIVETVSCFYESIRSIGALDFKYAKESFQKVKKYENEADTMHRELAIEISEGVFFAGIGEDLLNMLEKIDTIADSANNAAEILDQIDFDPELLTYFFQSKMLDYAKECLGTVKALRDAIKSLDQKRSVIIEKVKIVEEREEEADLMKSEVLEHLMHVHRRYNAVEILELESFLNMTDDVADNAEDASDVILVMIAKGYG